MTRPKNPPYRETGWENARGPGSLGGPGSWYSHASWPVQAEEHHELGPLAPFQPGPPFWPEPPPPSCASLGRGCKKRPIAVRRQAWQGGIAGQARLWSLSRYKGASHEIVSPIALLWDTKQSTQIRTSRLSWCVGLSTKQATEPCLDNLLSGWRKRCFWQTVVLSEGHSPFSSFSSVSGVWGAQPLVFVDRIVIVATSCQNHLFWVGGTNTVFQKHPFHNPDPQPHSDPLRTVLGQKKSPLRKTSRQLPW